jgi:hypothetical protein
MNRLFGILGILILLFEIYRFLHGSWLRQVLQKKTDPHRSRKPRVMKPKSERDCPVCMQEQGKHPFSKPDLPVAWSLRKGRGGPKKKRLTKGYFCPNSKCEYYGVIHE